MKLQISSFIFGFFLLAFTNCGQEKVYTFAEIEHEIQPYLDLENENIFWKSDTLVIYDSTFFKMAISVLKKYENHLEVGDSISNRLISKQLKELEEVQIQTKNPNLYIPINPMFTFYNTEKLDKKDKILKLEGWLLGLPKQFAAAKSQLQKTNTLQTKAAIQQLEKLYLFINEEVETISEKDFEKAKIAIKDYLGFLQSKLNNGEIE